MTNQQKLAPPVARVYIYCAPCACLLATAFNICRQAGSRATTYFEFLVRPDDRLVSSCCFQKDRSVGLASLIESVKKIESSETYLENHLKLLDGIWVEQRLYEIEEETDLPQSSTKIAQIGGKVLSSQKSGELAAGIIILGELGYCLQIMGSRPFASNPRIPKETEIFQMKERYVEGKSLWIRKFLGTCTPRAVPTTTPSTPQLPQTPLSTPFISTLVASETSPPTPSTPKVLGSAQGTSAPHVPCKISPPPSPTAKRQKSSPARSAIMDEEHS